MRFGDTPVPIPNTKVKTKAADGTALETVWESRRLPGLKRNKQQPFQNSLTEREKAVHFDKNRIKSGNNRTVKADFIVLWLPDSHTAKML